MNYVTSSNGSFYIGGSKFRFIGANCYPLIYGNYSVSVIDDFFDRCNQDGITVVRSWCFNKDSPATSSVGNFRYNNSEIITWIESTFVSLDVVLDSAMRHGIKMILPLVDNWQNNKEDYCRWSDSIYGTNYSTNTPWNFFDDNNIREIYKQFIDKLTSRINTINGRTYSLDDTIFSYELGNELTYTKGGDSNINTINSINIAALGGQSGWADIMSTYIKTKDTNHLVGFGDMGHFYDWVDGDTVHNGSYYGVDFNITGALSNIDYVDFHMYPFGDYDAFGLKKYGQALGYSNSVSQIGYKDQIIDYIGQAKILGKPIIIGEYGVDKRNTIIGNGDPYPRSVHFNGLFDFFFGSGGSGILLWHYSISEILDDNNYNIKPNGVHTGQNANNNDNDDDSTLREIITKYKSYINGTKKSGTRLLSGNRSFSYRN